MYFIALQMLFGDRGKYFAMVLGLTFASLIMTQQPAIYLGLMERTHAYIDEQTAPDIWVMDPAVQFVEDNKPLRDTDLQRVRGIPGVEWAVAIHKSVTNVLLPNGTRRQLEITGVDDATLIGAPLRMLQGKVEDLRQQDGLILDQVTAEQRLAYTDSTGVKHPVRVGDELEINDHRAVVVGIAKMKRTFTLMPMSFTTYTRSLEYLPHERRTISYIFVKMQKTADKNAIKTIVRDQLGLTAYTTEEFKELTKQYWLENTGIPINFGIAIGLGFIIGMAVAGQTFYSFVRDNVKQYATLKAMGTRNLTLTKMVLMQALVVGVVGYGIGVGITALFGQMIGDSELAFSMPPRLLLFSATGITVIVLISALIALRTVIRVDPAVVFRS